jgi:tRNA(His) guanylyltransferase
MGSDRKGGDRVRSLAEYQRLLERFETCNDTFILPGLHLVLRLDCRRHGRWDPEEYAAYPFGRKTVDTLVTTARYMMCFGPRIVLAYTHGDELCLYFDPGDTQALRRRLKFVSLLSSTASYSFQRITGWGALFYARLSELTSRELVVDFFLWQRRCAQRNRLVKAIRDALAAQGLNEQEMDAKLHGQSDDHRRLLASELGCDLSRIGSHERLGTFVWWGEKPDGGRPYVQYYTSDTSENEEQFEQFLQTRISGPSWLPDAPLEEIEIRPFDGEPPPASPHGAGTGSRPARSPGPLRLKRR